MRTLLLVITSASALFAQTSNYPAALDTSSTLFVTGDNVQSTLSQAVQATDTVIFVSSGTGFAANMIATVCDQQSGSTTAGFKCTQWEHMKITAVNGQALSVTRGFASTAAVTHLSGKNVSVLIDSAHQSSLSSAVIAIEAALGAKLGNLPTADIRQYGAVCDGVTNVDTAVQAAIATGVKRIYLPKNCFWQPGGNSVPGGIEYVGGDPNSTTIASSAPTASSIAVGSGAVLRNLRIHAFDCYAGAPPLNTDKFCPLTFYQNTDALSSHNISNYPNQFFLVDNGPDATNTDRTAISVNNFAAGGDGAFFQTLSGGGGINVWNSNTGTSGYGEHIFRNGPGDGLFVETGSLGAASGNDINISNSFKTGGQMLNFFQQTSAFNGNMISANLGSGSGSFGGSFMNLTVNGATRVNVNANGDVSAGYMTGWLVPQNFGTTGAVTFSSFQVFNTIITHAANASVNDTTPTAAAMIGNIAGCRINDSFPFWLRNTAAGANTITLVGGDVNVTLNGTMTIAQNQQREFRVVVTACTGTPAVTIYSMGAVAF